ncbi:hypothetical protein LCGC14_1694450 [marine sediment metagenome]|uniref:Uncharacterized protein n=1 Tax=marine sediment metagenome TaxID=412755 RepID=A0A0F9I7E3_9ZZZZ
MNESTDWKYRFIFLIAFLIGFYFGGIHEKCELWFYIGPDAQKVESSWIGIRT